MSETIEQQKAIVSLPKKRTKSKTKLDAVETKLYTAVVETQADTPVKQTHVRREDYYIDGVFSSKQYNDCNKDKAKQKASTMVKCKCTCWVRKDRMCKHIRTNKHIKILALTEPERTVPHIG